MGWIKYSVFCILKERELKRAKGAQSDIRASAPPGTVAGTMHSIWGSSVQQAAFPCSLEEVEEAKTECDHSSFVEGATPDAPEQDHRSFSEHQVIKDYFGLPQDSQEQFLQPESRMGVWPKQVSFTISIIIIVTCFAWRLLDHVQMKPTPYLNVSYELKSYGAVLFLWPWGAVDLVFFSIAAALRVQSARWMLLKFKNRDKTLSLSDGKVYSGS